MAHFISAVYTAGRVRPERGYWGYRRRFVAWDGDAGVPWLPGAPVDVARYLTALVGRGVGVAHRGAQDADSPAESEVVRLTLADAASPEPAACRSGPGAAR